MFDWIPRKLRYVVAASLILTIVAPTGLSHDTVITGHTVFKNAAGYDPCLASIAGLARNQVLWFNDAILAETNPEGSWLYAVEAGSKDPLERVIYGDGVVYEFNDPNENHWIVLQGYYYDDYYADPRAPVSGDVGDPTTWKVDPGVNASLNTTHVWAVEVGPTYRNTHHGADIHEFYNFVTIIDTCKFDGEREDNVTHAADDPYHPPGEDEHEHDVYEVDLYIGAEPRYVPAGVNSTQPRIYSETAHESGVDT